MSIPASRRGSFRRAAGALAVLACCASQLRAQEPAGARAEPATIILVRHAERAAEPASDPVLSPAGDARAASLVAALAQAGITSIVTTQYQRTRLTAAPLAQAHGLTPVAIATSGGLGAHVRAVADTIRVLSAGGTVLVVGHSNTVPRIIAALGGPPLPDLCETEFGTLFTLVLRPGAEPVLTRSRYGPDDPPPGAACTRQ